MIIRKAENRDIPAILRLLGQVLELHAEIRPDIFKPNTTKYGEAELCEMLCDEERIIFVADNGDDVLGYAFCEIRKPPFSSTMIPFASLYIDDLCVDENARGKHVGTLLFERVKEEARKLGCREITLAVWEGNNGAKQFYEKSGMKPKEIIMEYILD